MTLLTLCSETSSCVLHKPVRYARGICVLLWQMRHGWFTVYGLQFTDDYIGGGGRMEMPGKGVRKAQ